MTIRQLDLANTDLAQELLAVQLASYAIEAELIGFPDLPPLRETLANLQACDETFYGYFVAEKLAGAISYKIEDEVLDIHRMIVHPDHFRRGIARQLLERILAIPDIQQVVVMTGAANHPAKQLYFSFGFIEIAQEEVVEGLMISRFAKHMVGEA